MTKDIMPGDVIGGDLTETVRAGVPKADGSYTYNESEKDPKLPWAIPPKGGDKDPKKDQKG